MKNYKGQKGFTLVELSIVLVIIGLIISSVLVGKDLIRAAELRSTVGQYESFNAAIGTFKGKYNGLPGDIRGNTDFGFVGNGNGDGQLAAATALTGENVFFWNHLGSSGASLISGAYDGTTTGPTATTLDRFTPNAKVGENWGVYTASGINYFVTGVIGGAGAGAYTTSDIFTPLDARSLDEKIDDGNPVRGLVMARGANASNADTIPSDQCVSDYNVDNDNPENSAPTDASKYLTTVTTQTCNLRLRIQL